MSWVKLDDGFHDHRKVLAVSLEAIGLYALGLTWTSRHDMNGKLPKHVAHILARRECTDLVRELTDADLWHDDEAHYVVHDFLEYNPSAKSKASKRKAARERMRALRSSSHGVRANGSGVFARVPRGRDGTGTGSVSSASGGGAGGGFDAFWAAYPKRKSKQDAVRAFHKLAPDADLLAAMLAALDVQRRSRDWTKDGGRFVPLPATWLNGRRWEDEMLPVEPRRFETAKTQGNTDVFREFAEALP